MFLAALVHGIVILGVTFTVATFDDDRAPPSLNVTLLVDGRDEQAPDKADFIANRNSQAVGVAAKGLHVDERVIGERADRAGGQPRRRGPGRWRTARARAERR